MDKIYIHTMDVFNYKDSKLTTKWLKFCHKKALKCGLVCRVGTENGFKTLFMEGPKASFVKYYISTLGSSESKWSGVKRLIEIIKVK